MLRSMECGIEAKINLQEELKAQYEKDDQLNFIFFAA